MESVHTQYIYVYVFIYFSSRRVDGSGGGGWWDVPRLAVDCRSAPCLHAEKIIKFCVQNILSKITESVYCVIFNKDSGKI